MLCWQGDLTSDGSEKHCCGFGLFTTGFQECSNRNWEASSISTSGFQRRISNHIEYQKQDNDIHFTVLACNGIPLMPCDTCQKPYRSPCTSGHQISHHS
ncbi:hypothetical protein QVD17_35846 [Tagetes erecta]|uniref:Uncharacterized protein n=1 Tax=Tagetes erecta TaxID=13708 RepID=A0AAD8NBF8_TARER|nr:hypothetical protein QVD17_35846 [Tagetes erecta]